MFWSLEFHSRGSYTHPYLFDHFDSHQLEIYIVYDFQGYKFPLWKALTKESVGWETFSRNKVQGKTKYKLHGITKFAWLTNLI